MATLPPRHLPEALQRFAFDPSRFLPDQSGSPSLLSPPLTPYSEADVPWRPIDPSALDLNMKTAHHSHLPGRRRRSHVGHHVRASGYEAAATSPRVELCHLFRSKSMPELRYQQTCFDTRKLAARNTEARQRCINGKLRRWTLPRKAPSTRLICDHRSLVTQPVTHETGQDHISPAMITLRRATHKPSRKTSLTFFPPPTFSSAKGNIMSYLFTVVSNEGYHGVDRADLVAGAVTARMRPRSTSIAVGPAHVEVSLMAEPTVTEVQPNVYFASSEEEETTKTAAAAAAAVATASPSSRRCSTRFVSRSSVYEVIWDPNDSPRRASHTPPRPMAPDSSLPASGSGAGRRSSLAVEKLEFQLLRCGAA